MSAEAVPSAAGTKRSREPEAKTETKAEDTLRPPSTEELAAVDKNKDKRVRCAIRGMTNEQFKAVFDILDDHTVDEKGFIVPNNPKEFGPVFSKLLRHAEDTNCIDFFMFCPGFVDAYLREAPVPSGVAVEDIERQCEKFATECNLCATTLHVGEYQCKACARDTSEMDSEGAYCEKCAVRVAQKDVTSLTCSCCDAPVRYYERLDGTLAYECIGVRHNTLTAMDIRAQFHRRNLNEYKDELFTPSTLVRSADIGSPGY